MDVSERRRRRTLDSQKSLMNDSCQDDTYETPTKKPYCPSAPVSPDHKCVSSPESCDHLQDNLSSCSVSQMVIFSVDHNGVSDNASSEAARRVPRPEHALKGHGEELGTTDADMGPTSLMAIPSCLESLAIGLLPDGVSPTLGPGFDFDVDDIMCLSLIERDRNSIVEEADCFNESCQIFFEEQFNHTPNKRQQEQSVSGPAQGQCGGKTGRKENDGEESVRGNGVKESEKVAEGGVIGLGEKVEGEKVTRGVKEKEGEVLGGSMGRGLEDLSVEKEGQEMTRGKARSSEKNNKGASWSVNDLKREERFFTRSHHKALRAGKEARTLPQPQITSSPLVPGKELMQVPSSEQVPSSPESSQSQSAVCPPHFSFNLNDCSYSLFGSPPPPLSPVKRDGSEGTTGVGLRIGTPIPQTSVRHNGPVKQGAVREKRMVEADVEGGVSRMFQESQVSYLGEMVTIGNKYEMTVPSMHGLKSEPRKNTSTDVQLHKAESAWKPSVKKWARGCGGEDDEEKDSEQVQTQELLKQVRSILNRLTPDMLEKLTKQVTELNINTEEKLNGVINLIFEKAIAEPNFSSIYASICHGLMKVRVPTTEEPGVTVNFLRLLLNLCQEEFEKGQEDDEIFDRKQREMDDIKDEEKRECLKVALEAAMNKARGRSLGNIRFVGELFLLKMLPEAIMRYCIDKLLESPNEESLECLCKLLSTVGKDLDTEDAKACVDQYFDLMVNIIKERKTSTRIRFMLQDVLELRRSNWVSRRRHQGPKTIGQIHQEAEREELRELIKVQRQLHSRREGGGGGWMGGGLGSHGPHTPGGGWGSRLQFPGLKSNVQFFTCTTKRPERTSSSTSSAIHQPEKTSSSTSSTIHRHDKTSSSTSSTIHRHDKTSSSTIHRHEKTSSSTTSTIHRHERTTSSTSSATHRPENTKTSADWQCLAMLYQSEQKTIKTVQVESEPRRIKLTKPETRVVTTVQPQPTAIKRAPPRQKRMKIMPPEPKDTKITLPRLNEIKSVQPDPKVIRLMPPDPVQRKQARKTALSLVAFDREEDWQHEKQLYMDMVKKHMDYDEGAGQDVMTELLDLMTHVADQRPGANGKQWQHPSDLTRRNYQILFRNQTPVFSLHEWQNHNNRHHKRFSQVPDILERSPVL